MIPKEIFKEAEQDVKYGTDLASESLKIPELHSKYLNRHYYEKGKLRELTAKFKKLKKEKELYYDGKADPEVYKQKPFPLKLNKIQIKQHIESDDDVIDMQKDIDDTNDLIDFYKDVVSDINKRSYSITNAIKWKEFTSGKNG